MAVVEAQESRPLAWPPDFVNQILCGDALDGLSPDAGRKRGLRRHFPTVLGHSLLPGHRAVVGW